MSKQIDALKLALEWYDSGNERREEFEEMIKSILAQPEQALDKLFEVENELGLHYDEKPKQEPVALVISGALVKSELPENYTGHLYTTPPKREWVELTDEEIEQGCKESWVTEQAWQSAVWWAEAKLKEKNS